MSKYQLYNRKEFSYNRSMGLSISNKENRDFFKPNDDDGYFMYWTNEQFEEWLTTKLWSEENKEIHRRQFAGAIRICNGTIEYD